LVNNVINIQINVKKIQPLLDKWQKKNYYMKHIQASQFVTSRGRVKTAYNLVFSNLSLDESHYVFEVNSTELHKHYRKSRKEYVPTEITQVIRKNELLYSTIFTRINNRSEKHLAYWNDTLSEHKKRMNRMRNRGYVLKAQSFTYHKDDYSISSIYIATARDWFTEYNLTIDESLNLVYKIRNTYVVTSISAYLLNTTTKFALIFEKINHPDYFLWTVWDRPAEYIRELISNYTAPNNQYEATAIVGFQSYNEIHYIITLGDIKYYND